jgi:predicted dehydrogenase
MARLVLWQGPAPERAYRDNYLHYHWHWYWHWGTGELGNNGVHMIDVCRWGLGVDYARRVTSGGDKLRYDDDQETPDTNVVTFDFGGPMAPSAKSITWENRSWAAKTPNDPKPDVVFFGEKGTLQIDGNGYNICDPAGKEIAKGNGPGGDAVHPAELRRFDPRRGKAERGNRGGSQDGAALPPGKHRLANDRRSHPGHDERSHRGSARRSEALAPRVPKRLGAKDFLKICELFAAGLPALSLELDVHCHETPLSSLRRPHSPLRGDPSGRRLGRTDEGRERSTSEEATGRQRSILRGAGEAGS